MAELNRGFMTVNKTQVVGPLGLLAKEREHALHMIMSNNFLVEINQYVRELSFACIKVCAGYF